MDPYVPGGHVFSQTVRPPLFPSFFTFPPMDDERLTISGNSKSFEVPVLDRRGSTPKNGMIEMN